MEQDMPLEENEQAMNEEEFLDETPEFVTPEDAVEVKVDDDNVPMDEEEDDEMEETTTREAIDMSKAKIESHTGPIYAVASYFDASTQTLAMLSGGGDDKAFLHRAVSGSAPSTSPLEHAHTDSVSCVAFNMEYITEDLSKTPPLAAVGGYDGAIVLYDPTTGNKLKNLEGPTDVEWLCFHPKGGTVLLAGSAADGTIWMFHIPMNKCLQVFVGHESAVTAGSFSPDGKWALSASSDGTVRVWAPRTGMSKHVFRLGEGAGLTCMAVNGGSDGQLVIAGAEDGQAHVCHIGTKKVVASLRHCELPTNMQEDEELELPMSVEAVGFASQSVNPNWCATGGVDGVLKIWDLAIDGQCRQTCRLPRVEGQNDSSNGGITRLQWHPNLPLVFVSSTTGNVHLWDARNGNLLQTWTGHVDTINDMNVQFMDEGRTAVILSVSDDKTLRMYDADVMSLVRTAEASSS